MLIIDKKLTQKCIASPSDKSDTISAFISALKAYTPEQYGCLELLRETEEAQFLPFADAPAVSLGIKIFYPYGTTRSTASHHECFSLALKVLYLTKQFPDSRTSVVPLEVETKCFDLNTGKQTTNLMRHFGVDITHLVQREPELRKGLEQEGFLLTYEGRTFLDATPLQIHSQQIKEAGDEETLFSDLDGLLCLPYNSFAPMRLTTISKEEKTLLCLAILPPRMGNPLTIEVMADQITRGEEYPVRFSHALSIPPHLWGEAVDNAEKAHQGEMISPHFPFDSSGTTLFYLGVRIIHMALTHATRGPSLLGEWEPYVKSAENLYQNTVPN